MKLDSERCISCGKLIRKNPIPCEGTPFWWCSTGCYEDSLEPYDYFDGEEDPDCIQFLRDFREGKFAPGESDAVLIAQYYQQPAKAREQGKRRLREHLQSEWQQQQKALAEKEALEA